MTTGLPAGRPSSITSDYIVRHGEAKPFAQLSGHYEELATSLADAVLAGESGCGSLKEFAAASGAEPVVFDGTQLGAFDEFHAGFATRLTTGLVAAGQAEVTVEPAFTDRTTFGEYLLSVANGNAVFQMSANFRDGDFAVNLPVRALHGIAPGQPVDRAAAVAAWGPLLARTLAGLWSPLRPGTVSVRDCYLGPYGPLRFAPMYEVGRSLTR